MQLNNKLNVYSKLSLIRTGLYRPKYHNSTVSLSCRCSDYRGCFVLLVYMKEILY